MNRIRCLLKLILVCAMSTFLLLAIGCEGTETRGNVDKGVEKFTGKDKVELMEKMKADVEESMEKQADRLKQTEYGQTS